MALESIPAEKAPWPPEGTRKRRPVGSSHTESFGTIAREAEMDVWALIEFNFKTRNPREVNWYLREYVGCVKTTQDGKNYTFEGADPQKAAIYIPRAEILPISKWSVEKKREEAIRRSLKLMPAETAHAIEAMLTPEALAIMGAATAVFAVSHFVGIGEIIDLILAGVGIITLEIVGWQALDELQSFVQDADAANVEDDLEKSAQHFAKATSMLGVQLIAAILFKGRPKKTFNKSAGVSESVLARMPKTPGKVFYRSITRGRSSKPAGAGATSIWGDIWYSTKGSLDEQRLAQIHEQIHSLLTPKLQFLREFRVELGINSYKKSFILKYLEEALAETVAQLAVNKGFISGIAFPVKNGYVTIAELATEAAGILMGPVNISGQAYWAIFSGSEPDPPARG
jgi:hypothetical protein